MEERRIGSVLPRERRLCAFDLGHLPRRENSVRRYCSYRHSRPCVQKAILPSTHDPCAAGCLGPTSRQESAPRDIVLAWILSASPDPTAALDDGLVSACELSFIGGRERL